MFKNINESSIYLTYFSENKIIRAIEIKTIAFKYLK